MLPGLPLKRMRPNKGVKGSTATLALDWSMMRWIFAPPRPMTMLTISLGSEAENLMGGNGCGHEERKIG